jgi:GTP pyrophosphokinase
VLHLFAPVAARLGIHSLKQRLEALAFPIVYPADAQHVAEQLAHIRKRHGPFLPQTANLLSSALAEQGIAASVAAREKLPFSVFNKMRQKALSQVDSLPDLYGLRVLVDTEEQCYRTLGFLHRIGLPMTNRFKDYIAFPKPNGYRSLHTTVGKLPGVPEGVFTEVQVRTRAMHREAEYGIAAHWSYKEGGTAEQALARVSLHHVLTEQHEMEDEGAPTFVDHIFVLTPKGDIVELPEGATPLDFAFQIHTDLGLGFRSARVNEAVVPLDYQLENGDVVEVLTNRVPKPSTEWLQLLKMASSRSRLKRYLYSLHREDYVARGRESINEDLRRLHMPALDNDFTLLRFYDGKELAFSEREDLLMKIGQGSERAGALLPHLDALAGVRLLPSKRKVSVLRKMAFPVAVEGNMSMPLRFAKCCKPETGERSDIIGSVARKGEVIVHRAKCRMLKLANPGRQVKVWWREEEKPVAKKASTSKKAAAASGSKRIRE